MTVHANIALITGLEMEAGIARKAMKKSDAELSVFVAGMGAPNGQQVVQQAKREGAKGIVSLGYCGGLDPALRAGDIVIPEMVVGNNEIKTSAGWRRQLIKKLENQFSVLSCPLLSVESVVKSPAEKAELFNRYKACAVDMESLRLAQLAAENNLEFIAVRVVHDPASQVIPVAFNNIINSNGSINGWNLIKGLIFHWPGAKTLKALSGQSIQAKTNLDQLTRLALPGFGFID